MVVLGQLVAIAPATWGTDPPRRILVLYDFPRPTPAILAHEQAFTAAFKAAPEPVNVYAEYLNLSQLSQSGAFPLETVGYLREKYARERPDLVVVVSSGILRFVLAHRSQIFPGVPVVFSAVDQATVADLPLPADVTGIWLSISWAGTLETIRRLQPDVSRVVVVGGSSAIDRIWMAAARTQLEPVRGAVEVAYVYGVPLESIVERLADLFPRTVVLLGTLVRDATGRGFVGAEASARIAAASPVPVYTVVPTMVGSGVVGGHVVDFAEHGRQAARLAIEMLRGQRPPPHTARTNAYLFDARQLRRWGLDAGRLPADSILLFDEPSAWQRYGPYIVAGIALIVVQGGLIATLLALRSKRRRAQRELAHRLRFETLLADLSALFVSQPLVEVDRQIQTALLRIGDELGVDRVTVGEYVPHTNAVQVTHSWTRPGVRSLPDVLDRALLPWIDAQVRRGQAVCLSRPDDLPVEAVRDRRTLAEVGTRSLAIVPLVMSGSVAGLLALATARDERQWSGELAARLTLLAEIFAGAVARQRADRATEEARRHREELAHVQRVTTLGELAASLAHEIRQPLAAIVTNAQAAVRSLEEMPCGSDGVKSALEEIVEEGQRAARVIHGLRAMFRKEQPDHQPVSVNALIEDVVALLRHDFQRKGIAVVLGLEPTLPRLRGDAVQLRQVVLNLLVNSGEAIGATHDGARQITVATSRRPAGVLALAVTDTGVGVNDADLETIFTRFVSSKSRGLGMGLTICRSIIEEHGGRIWATHNPGRGLTVNVELPLEESASAP
jgi:signal transduction histidine kinase/ABC-type uncharacterized transport system substrate-binding protein